MFARHSQFFQGLLAGRNSELVRISCLLMALQIAVTALLIWLFSFPYGAWGMWSALLGGTLCVLGSIIFSSVFLFFPANTPQRQLAAIYVAEVIKWFFSIFAFALVFWLLAVQPMVFFITYLAVLSMNGVILLAGIDLKTPRQVQ